MKQFFVAVGGLIPAIISAAALTACGPNPKAPVKVMVIAPGETASYEPRQVELTSITSITALKGSIAEFVGGARVVLDEANDPVLATNGGLQNMTDTQRYEALVKDKGLDVRLNLIERGDVLWPADFHSWNMVTTYFNFERAHEYFNKNMPMEDPPELRNMRILYNADLRLNTASSMTDNFLYLSLVKSFIVLPPVTFQKVPVSMNLGIVGHEMAHRVFNARVLEDKGVHPFLSRWNGLPFNLLKSLDEGLADFHGYGATSFAEPGLRPRFLDVSIPDEATVDSRNVAKDDACMDASLRAALSNPNQGEWVNSKALYEVGTLFAAALFQAGTDTGKMGALQQAVFESYDDADSMNPGLSQLVNRNLDTPGAFTAEAITDSIAGHIDDDELRKAFCKEATDRLQLSCPQFPCNTILPHCQGAARGTSCKVIP